MFTNVNRPSAVDVLRPFTVGDIFTADTTSTLAKVADVAVGNVLLSGGVGVIPAWGKVTLSSHVSGVLPAINGGTGVANTGTIANASNTTITGGGTLALGGFTLTVPATGTAGLLGVANTWTAVNTFSNTTSATSSTVGAVVIGDGTATTTIGLGSGRVQAGGNNHQFGNASHTSLTFKTIFDEGEVQFMTSGTNTYWDTNIRPNSGQSAFLSFTEAGVADRWSIGIVGGSGTLHFSSSRVATTGTLADRMTLTSTAMTLTTNATAGLTIAATTGTTLTVSSTNASSIATAGGISVASGVLITSTAAFTNGAAAATGTLLNAPAAGNPTKWIPINDNGTTRYIPAW